MKSAEPVVPKEQGLGTIVWIASVRDRLAVHLHGAVNANLVQATQVEFVTTPDDKIRNFLGEVKNFNGATGAFSLFNLDMRLTDTTTFRNADLTPAARSAFGNGDRVQVRGAFASGVFVVSDVIFRPGPAVVITSVDGIVYDVDITAGVFKIDGTVVKFDTTTTFNLTRDNVHNGTRVVVQGTVVNGQLVAGSVEIKLADGATGATVRSDITDFVSAANFRVDGQMVDASSAQISGGSATDLASGKTVEASGPVIDGVLKAARLTFVK